MPKFNRDSIVNGTATEVTWWLKTRLNKFKELSHATMSINPFMAPVIMALHSQTSFGALAEQLLAGHFMTGHATGFGKLIDEKLLPNVFGTTKLDKKFRKSPPFNSSIFDEIDHIVGKGNSIDLLSLKASRWTIQLTMATKLNATFGEILKERTARKIKFGRIVVGVIYGQADDMTDKYRLIRGISRGAEHNVLDIKQFVDVVTGRDLWTWLNGGEVATQDWIVDGILQAVAKSTTILKEAEKHIAAYKAKFSNSFNRHITNDKIDWHGIAKDING